MEPLEGARLGDWLFGMSCRRMAPLEGAAGDWSFGRSPPRATGSSPLSRFRRPPSSRGRRNRHHQSCGCRRQRWSTAGRRPVPSGTPRCRRHATIPAGDASIDMRLPLGNAMEPARAPSGSCHRGSGARPPSEGAGTGPHIDRGCHRQRLVPARERLEGAARRLALCPPLRFCGRPRTEGAKPAIATAWSGARPTLWLSAGQRRSAVRATHGCPEGQRQVGLQGRRSGCCSNARSAEGRRHGADRHAEVPQERQVPVRERPVPIGTPRFR